MNGSVKIGPQFSKLWDELKLAAASVITSLPSIPADTDLVNVETGGSLLTGETVTIEVSAAGATIANAVITKFTAAAKA